MPWPTRSSRATIFIGSTLPPCEVISTSLRKPARFTLSPISIQARIALSQPIVSVPGECRCSFDLQIACVGRTRTSRSAGTSGIASASIPFITVVSTETGRCGPCCSIAANGSTATVRSGVSAVKSELLRSPQERQLQHRILGAALDARPHDLALLATVGACAGNQDEDGLRARLHKRLRRRDRHVIGDAAVVGLRHANRADAEAEEAGVEAGKLGLQGGEISHIGMYELPQFRIDLPDGPPADRDDACHLRIEQALAQD